MRSKRDRCPRASWFVCGTLLTILAACSLADDRPSADGPACKCSTGTPATSSTARAGAALSADAVPARLAQVLARPQDYAGKLVRLEGEVEQVCPMRGCWLMLRDGDARARVTFKNYGFFVPPNAKGKRVRLDAEIVRETMSQEMAVHLESETEGGDPGSIRGPQEVVSVIATGIEIFDAAAQPASE